ncbi:MAG: PQQ-dependent sugar dehydrogenase [Saprospiraceae bacterium]|nr:PQQ-dependent sugar dehydrogenase [Saprospiraceae bacterium]MBK9631562.1 PQQ-dependent sugar dehydrogenase [Saprospiraceae bacterium]
MKKILLLSILFFLGLNLKSQNGIRLSQVARGFSIPVYLTHAEDNRLFVVEKQGRIRIIENGIINPIPFLNIVSKVNSRNNEQGLLGLAFHPDYKVNGKFYVNYSAPGAGNTIVAEYLVNPNNANKADSLSERILMEIPQPYSNHNGGCLKFGPDKYLYIGMGDGGSGGDPQNYAQNTRSLLGKMLRIDVDTSAGYKIPNSNPFASSLSILPEIWSIGLRNPWRFSFDKLTGDMWIGDVGQGEWEEIDFQSHKSTGGDNFGWRCYEGDVSFNLSGCSPRNNYTFPVVAYKGDEFVLGCSVTGGYVYRADSCSYLYGQYIYGDYCSGIIWSIRNQGDSSFTNQRLFNYSRGRISSFGEDQSGQIYLVDISEGSIYKITDTCSITLQDSVIDLNCSGTNNGSISILNDPLNFNFLWSNGDTTSSISGLSAGIYSVTVTQGQCMIKKSYQLKSGSTKTACIVPILKADACEGDSILLIACEDPDAESFLWYKDSILVSESIQRTFHASESGIYSLKIKDKNDCISNWSSEIEITIHPLPPKPLIKIQGDIIQAPSGFISYNWYLDGQFLSSSSDSNLLIDQRGFFQLSVIDQNNCESELSDSVFLVPSAIIDPKVEFFSLFPNPGSGIFNLILDARLQLPFEILVYDENGNVVWQNTAKDVHHQILIDIQHVPNGIYLVLIKSNKQNIQQRTKINKI